VWAAEILLACNGSAKIEPGPGIYIYLKVGPDNIGAPNQDRKELCLAGLPRIGMGIFHFLHPGILSGPPKMGVENSSKGPPPPQTRHGKCSKVVLAVFD
jgi:hypothetical protein